MQRVLSYQAAVQINDDRDVRAYITKRTCVSVIFSTSFLVLILGFLLGKFVSDRQYRIRQLQEAEYVNLIRELHTIRKSIEMSADNISSFSAEQLQVKYNRKLWDTVANCTSTTIEHDFNVLFDQFVAKLVDNELKLVVECFQKIKTTVKSIEFESN